MPLRLRPTFFAICAVFAATFLPSLSVQAQQRGRLPSRSFSLRLNTSLLSKGRTGKAPSARFARVPGWEAPRRVVWKAPTVGNAPNVTPITAPIASPIALGPYFYQNGQCAPGDAGAVSAWRARAGRMPAVWMIFQGWTGWNRFPVAQARRARSLGGQLLVTWEPWSGAASSKWSCARVAAGSNDTYIRQYARAVKSSGVPVMIRFAHEMNGNWYPWGTAYDAGFRRHNGNSPANYVAMWRRVVSLFRQEGATNARWVWAPNIHFLNENNSRSNQNNDLYSLYPGDNYVDWVGLSVYNDGARRPWRSFSSLFEGAYQCVTRISNKPLMIAELGATEAGAPSGSSKASWISQTMMNEIPALYPRVKLVNWFCRDKSADGEANYRFDSSPGALRAFRIAANSPLYSARLGN